MWYRAVVGCLLLGITSAGAAGGQTSRLGTISFPTSAGPAAQAEFVTGVLWLHSFEYERAAAAFRRAQQGEPGFALAYWGEAMTYTHPVWNEQDAVAARAVLARLAPDPAARRSKAPTERERMYLDAVEILYGTGSKPRRDTLYAEAMRELSQQYPDDHEAKAFYALALLGLNQGVRDTTTYLRSAPYADTVFRANRTHPGAAHYLIHAFDDPYHAHLGLDAARAYSGIAPDAPHAQHMTTHIFLALGMWPEVVSQNLVAMNLTAERPGHYSSWLHYGLIQQGRLEEAQDLLVRLSGNMDSASTSGTNSYRSYMRAHHVLHADELRDGPATWRLPLGRMSPLAQASDAYARGVMAFRAADKGSLTGAAAEASAIARRIASTVRGSPDAMQTLVMARELEALIAVLNGSRDAAVRTMREAAALEDSIPIEFGPPAIVEPSHELLGFLLLDTDPKGAMAAFERALVLAPRRARALEGLTRAAAASGDVATARRALEELADVWRSAEPPILDRLERLRAEVNQPR